MVVAIVLSACGEHRAVLADRETLPECMDYVQAFEQCENRPGAPPAAYTQKHVEKFLKEMSPEGADDAKRELLKSTCAKRAKAMKEACR